MMDEDRRHPELNDGLDDFEYDPETEPDGGYSSPIIENRERLVRVERGQQQVLETVDRVEDKIDTTKEALSSIDDRKLSEDRFDDQYAEAFDTWREYFILVKWMGAVLVIGAAVLQVVMMTDVV